MYKAHYAERGYSCAVDLINRLSFYSRRGIALIRRRGLLCNASSWQLSQCSNPFKPHVACPDTAPAALAGSDSHVAAAVAATPSSLPLTGWLPELVTCGTEIVLQLYQAEIVLPNPLVTISCFARNSLDLLFQHTEADAPPVLIFYCWTDVWFTRINTTLINSSVAVISVFFLLSNTGCNGFRLKYS